MENMQAKWNEKIEFLRKKLKGEIEKGYGRLITVLRKTFENEQRKRNGIMEFKTV